MKNIATDIYSFESLINDGFIYVDKTQYLYNLVNLTKGKQFFLSRPRRFGKSLLLSTIQAIFEGKRKLFEGMYINNTDYDWQTYPVIRLDMNNVADDDVEITHVKVKYQLEKIASCHGIRLNKDEPASVQFERIITEIASKSREGQAVLLIDEYDKPLLSHLGFDDVLPYQRFLKQFYGVVKSTESYQRFCLMTGVSKFSKVSIFSDLNNLRDITMSPQFAGICGFTHDEVRNNFHEHIQTLADENAISYDAAFDKLCKMYDGYMFCENTQRLFNPVSLGNCLIDKQFKSFWFETGTPGGLMDYLKTHPMDLSNYIISSNKLGTYDPVNPGTVPLLFQTGYLTIADIEGEPPLFDYVLDFPNLEVKAGFNSWLAEAYINNDNRNMNDAYTLARRSLKALRAGDVNEFIQVIKAMFSAIPYELLDNANEHEYHALFHTMLYISASNISSEVQTNLGRIDSFVQAGDYAYVIEFKLDKSADEALAQINGRKYYEPYQHKAEQLILLGINFSTENRNIEDFKHECI